MLHTLHMLFHLIFAINVQDKWGVLVLSFIVAGIRLNLTVTETQGTIVAELGFELRDPSSRGYHFLIIKK